MELVCPRCTGPVHANPGEIARCGSCGYSGGRVDGGTSAPAPTQAYTPTVGAPGQEESEVEIEEKPETSGLATASIVMGACFFIPPAGIVAIITGLAALSHIGKHPEVRGKPLAITGIVMGGIFQLLWFGLFIALIAGIARARDLFAGGF